VSSSDERNKVKLVDAPHGCYDYACAVCDTVYPFYDQALDCVLSHKIERAQKSGRHRAGPRGG